MDEVMLDTQTRQKVRTHMAPWTAEKLVKDVPATAGEDDSIADIISLMVKFNVGEIPIVQGSKVVGVVSRTFLLKRRDLNLTTKAKTIMVNHPHFTKEKGIIEMAEQFVSTNARQLFVVEGGKLKGMVSREDVVNVIPKVPELSKIRVHEFMCDDLDYVDEKDSVSKAMEMMNELDTPVLPVVDRNMRVQGIIGLKNLFNTKTSTENRTTVNDRIGQRHSAKLEVGAIMTQPAITMDINSTLGDAVNMMLNRSISTVVAVNSDKHTEGIVTVYDLLSLIAGLKEQPQVYVQVSGLGGEDAFYLDEVYKEVEDFVRRVKNMVDLHSIDLHFDIYHKGGDNKKFSLRFRVMTDKGAFHAKATDWSASKVTADASTNLERQIKTAKDIRLSGRSVPKA